MINELPFVLADSSVFGRQAIVLVLWHQLDYGTSNFTGQTQFVADSRRTLGVRSQQNYSDVGHLHPFFDLSAPLIVVFSCRERLIFQDKFAMLPRLTNESVPASPVFFELKRQKDGSGFFGSPTALLTLLCHRALAPEIDLGGSQSYKTVTFSISPRSMRQQNPTGPETAAQRPATQLLRGSLHCQASGPCLLVSGRGVRITPRSPTCLFVSNLGRQVRRTLNAPS